MWREAGKQSAEFESADPADCAIYLDVSWQRGVLFNGRLTELPSAARDRGPAPLFIRLGMQMSPPFPP